MNIKYALRTISPAQHPCYLQQGQYGLSFNFSSLQPYSLHYFDTREEAIDWINANFIHPTQYIEIVEVYIPE